MKQIAESLGTIFGDVKIKYEAARPHDFEGSVTSIEKAKRLLKWKPKTVFKEGLKKYIEYVKKTTPENE
jgi:nucleoside-diphosphate-sugar epimerase